MGILKHKPFFLWIVTGFLAFVGLLIGLEVYRMPLIFWTLQNVGYGIARPVIGIVRRRVSRCPACLLKMDCRRYDFILFQNTGNLRRPVTARTKGKYPLDYCMRELGREYGALTPEGIVVKKTDTFYWAKGHSFNCAKAIPDGMTLMTESEKPLRPDKDGNVLSMSLTATRRMSEETAKIFDRLCLRRKSVLFR